LYQEVLMKKLFMVGLLSFGILSPLWADDSSASECYNSVAQALKKSSQFNRVLVDVWTNVDVKIECADTGHSYGDIPLGVKRGDTVYTRDVNADLTIEIRPLVQGSPIGGTQQIIKVQGVLGYKFGIGNSEFFDVSVFNYEKRNLR